jgi:hypothetical protein
MLKRSGRGHDPEGAGATSLGELAIECPACPHPDRNLPPDWNSGGPRGYLKLFIINRLNCLLIKYLFIDTYILYSLQLMAITSYD